MSTWWVSQLLTTVVRTATVRSDEYGRCLIDGTVRVGISDFAPNELGDVVFVELPREGDDVSAGDAFGVVESIKAVPDLYAPVSGTVTEANDDLESEPELVNDDPFGDGWMIEVELSDEGELDDLLSPEEYREQIA